MAGGFVGNRVFFSPEMAGAGKRYSWVTGGKIGDCWLSVLGGDTTPDGTDVLVGAEPGFRAADRQNFRPAGGFPLIGRGGSLGWPILWILPARPAFAAVSSTLAPFGVILRE